MNPIAKRTITALATAAALVALFLYCPLRMLPAIIVALSALVQLEFYQMAAKYHPVSRFGIALGTVFLALSAALSGAALFERCLAVAAMALAPFMFGFAVYVMCRTTKYENPIGTIASTLFGFFYVPFLLSFFLRFVQLGTDGGIFAMPETRTGLYTLFAFLAITKLSDMGGFAFGMAFGRHKMCPAVSPKKSWEGFVGSLLGSSLMALVFRQVAIKHDWAVDCPFWDHLGLGGAVLLGCVIATLGTLGDLVESRFKRECGVKDSATFMPAGMGGFLDMFDSVLFIPALAYPLVMFFSR